MSKNTTLKVPKKEENIKTVSAWHGKATNHESELSKSHKSMTKKIIKKEYLLQFSMSLFFKVSEKKKKIKRRNNQQKKERVSFSSLPQVIPQFHTSHFRASFYISHKHDAVFPLQEVGKQQGLQ